jgi:integral membrane protein (TIGR00529 family)
MGVIMSAAMILLGYLFFLRRIAPSSQKPHTVRAIGRILLAIWPLMLAVVLALGIELDIVAALVAAVGATILFNRISPKTVWRVMSGTATFRLLMLVFGILVFKDLMEATGAVAAIPDTVSHLGIPPVAILFTVAFLTGLLSGMLAAFVGLSFPILAGYLYIPEINAGNIFFTFLSGYLGMILSPTHFCLLLTSEHFKADLGSVYRAFVIPVIFLALFGFSLYLFGYPWNIIVP